MNYQLPTSRKAAITAGSRYYFNGRVCPQGHVSKYMAGNPKAGAKRGKPGGGRAYKCYECHLDAVRRSNASRKARGFKQVHVDHAASSICKHARRYLFGSESYLSKYSKRLGCTGRTFRAHIEAQFMPGMTWQNYGRRGDQWQIDHIIPLADFDLHDPTQAAMASHYTNVRPLWSVDNWRKAWVHTPEAILLTGG
jgi:hypothetical protein